jgi:hypothetical protein
MTGLWKHAVAPLLALATLVACAAPQADEGDDPGSSEDAIVATVSAAERVAVEKTSIADYQFDHLTPTGQHLFKAAVYWKSHQLEDPRYPVARMCASNVSKALYLGGVTEFNAEGVYNLIRAVGSSEGGEVHRLPMPAKNAAGRLDKTAFLAELNAVDHGKIPTGTIVAGCLTAKCDAMPGEQHVGIVGQTDADGTIWVWHNNWYRPENEGGAWKPFMIYSENHDLYTHKGLRREWMATPWLRVKRDATGKVIDAASLVPAIDDLDPFGGLYGGTPKYHMTLAVIPELAADLHAH